MAKLILVEAVMDYYDTAKNGELVKTGSLFVVDEVRYEELTGKNPGQFVVAKESDKYDSQTVDTLKEIAESKEIEIPSKAAKKEIIALLKK